MQITTVTKQEQIQKALEKLVRQSKPGDQIPTEAALAQQYGVARPTVAGAIFKPVGVGKLKRIQGKGIV